ncbi:MAG: hypothetical protein FJ304_15565 [Planctomycetes bacterium]|nr:hypothetical protein [Planctomycetota bacterium]
MTLVLATLPDDAARHARWLEERMVSGEVGALAAELAAVHRAEPPNESVRDRLGAWVDEVLRDGLSVLPREHLTHLLRQPYHLLELQELVLLEGGAYWAGVNRPPEFQAAVRANLDGLTEFLFAPLAEPLPEPRADPTRAPRSRDWRLIGAVLVTAAVVFVATFGMSRFLLPPPAAEVARSKPWGWNRPDAFPAHLDRAAYLNRLADEANEWSAERPSDFPTATQRISEFRQGCTALLAADHAPLSPDDRRWLRERCQKWGADIDKHLADLKDTGDTGAALAATDATVQKLAKALRDRAAG